MAGIDYTLGLKTAGFSAGVKGAVSKLGDIGKAAAAAAATIGVAAGAFAGMATVMGLKKAFDVGGELSDLSARTGAAVKDLVILQLAFKDAGVGAEQVGSNLNRMQRALAGVSEDGEQTSGTFSRLGLDMGALKKMGAVEQLEAIGEAIRKIPDPAARAAAAMGIFGRSGGELLPLFLDSGALGNAAKTMGKQAELLERNAAIFDRISDLLASAGVKLQGFFVGMADRVGPVLLPLLDRLDALDLSDVGKRLGESLRNAIGILKVASDSGQFFNTAATGLKVIFLEAVNILSKGVASVVMALQAAFEASGLEKKLSNIAKGIGKSIGAEIADAMNILPGKSAKAETMRKEAEGFFKASSGGLDLDAGAQEFMRTVQASFQSLADIPGLEGARKAWETKTKDFKTKMDSEIATLEAEYAARNEEKAKSAVPAVPLAEPTPAPRVDAAPAPNWLERLGFLTGGGAKNTAAERTLAVQERQTIILSKISESLMNRQPAGAIF